MLTLVTTALLSMAAMKGDPLDDARKAFNNCMIEVHNTAIGEKASPSAFIQKSESSCTAERAAYHAIMVRTEISFKSTPKEAEQFAKEEVQSLIDSIVTAFNDNIESGAKLSLEK